MLQPDDQRQKRLRHPGGRPPKFREPSQPVTITLPHRTLDQLKSLDEDRAKAVVKAVDVAMGTGPRETPGAPGVPGVPGAPLVDVVEMAPGMSLLVVPPSRSLRRIPWLTLIEVSPLRNLLVIRAGTSIEKVEITLMDLIDDAGLSAPDEVPLLEALRERLTHMRRGERLSKVELLVVARDEDAAP